jgi:thiol:disulfide interchange protein DsbA
MHVERSRLNRDEQVFDWVAANGIDRQKFIDTYRSFGVQAKVKRTEGMMDSYKIDSWPTLIVDGRFQASPHLAAAGMQGNPTEAELQAAALQVMDFLVAKAKAEKK